MYVLPRVRYLLTNRQAYIIDIIHTKQVCMSWLVFQSCFYVHVKIHSTTLRRTGSTEHSKARSSESHPRDLKTLNKGVVWPLLSLLRSSCIQFIEKPKEFLTTFMDTSRRSQVIRMPDTGCLLRSRTSQLLHWHKHLAYNIQYNYRNQEKERTDYCIEHLKRCFLSAPLYPACSLCKKSKRNSKHDAVPYDAMQSDAKSVEVKESHTINLVFLRQISSHDS